MQRLYTIDLPPGDFLTVLKRFPFNEENLLLAFSPARFKFQRFSLDGPFLAASDQGRIFSPAGELKWRRVGKHIRLVYLGNQMPPQGFTDHSEQLEPLMVNLGTGQFYSLKEAVDYIRDYAKYVFWRNPSRLKGYRSNHMRNSKRKRTRKTANALPGTGTGTEALKIKI